MHQSWVLSEIPCNMIQRGNVENMLKGCINTYKYTYSTYFQMTQDRPDIAEYRLNIAQHCPNRAPKPWTSWSFLINAPRSHPFLDQHEPNRHKRIRIHRYDIKLGANNITWQKLISTTFSEVNVMNALVKLCQVTDLLLFQVFRKVSRWLILIEVFSTQNSILRSCGRSFILNQAGLPKGRRRPHLHELRNLHAAYLPSE
jgi:hypothetical protein